MTKKPKKYTKEPNYTLGSAHMKDLFNTLLADCPKNTSSFDEHKAIRDSKSDKHGE
jgi:hypothetical protein